MGAAWDALSEEDMGCVGNKTDAAL
ncbi:hypothetical protein LMED105_03977 [Limnobacter sp. MED105]|nr:hypothetical protein LMED105_03977 [Limnobacter sp. MED105]